jgi:dihydroxy-acid dehydratase
MEKHNGTQGFRKGLTDYGDVDFSLFLRNAFIKGAGYGDDALSRAIVGIVNTASGYNPIGANLGKQTRKKGEKKEMASRSVVP